MTIAFTCPVAPLRRCVERVAKIVERRNTMPILANVLIEVEANGRLTVVGTDLDIEAVATTTTQVAKDVQPGGITVTAALFLDILKTAKADIKFTHEGNGQVVVQSGRSRFKLFSLPVVDFPRLTGFNGAARFDITPKLFERIPACLGFAQSDEEQRFFLNGIFLHLAPDDDGRRQLTAVATDGHRLSYLTLPEIEIGDDMPSVIIPKKMVSLFGLLAGAVDADETIGVEVSDQKISFTTPELRIVSKLIDGTFPDYVRVIPRGNDRKALIPRDEFSAAVERVLKISSERGRAVAFSFDGTDALNLRCHSQEAGEAVDSIPVTGDFDPIEIGFNGRYVLDLLNTFAGETVEIALNDPGSPAVLTDVGDPTRLVVLMPMRV